MAFPSTPLSATVELNLNGTWTDITNYVYVREDGVISITRGRRNEGAGNIDPGTLALTLNNQDGRFSPRNASGPYYGLIGRNTPIRVSALIGPPRLVKGTGFSDGFSAPDTAAISIVGDLDVRADLRMPDWTASIALAQKSGVGGDSWELQVNGSAQVVLAWSTTGSGLSLVRTSTVPLPRTTGRQAVRATLSVNNGAGGHTVTFFYSDTISGTWVQLGDPVVTAGVTSIFDGTASLRACSSSSASVEIYALKLLQGIGGTERANPDFTAQAEGAASFADAAGNTWTRAGSGAITARRYRVYSEVTKWPQAWDLSGKDVWVPLEASGVVRRLAQSAPLLGPIQRGVLRSSSPTYAYWPMTDESQATSVSSGLTGGPPMSIVGSPRLATNDTLFAASDPLPEMGLATFSGAVIPYTATGSIHVRCLLGIPAAGDNLNANIIRIFTTGTAAVWDLLYTGNAPGPGLTLRAYGSDGTQLFTQGAAFTVHGQKLIAGFELVQNGANVDWHMFSIDYYNNTGLGFSSTLAGQTSGGAVGLQINAGGVLDTTVIGQVVLTADIPAAATFTSPLRGWAGETAGARVKRLCAEEGVAFQAYGDLTQTVAMGVQPAGNLLDLLGQCEATDLGQVFESRAALGLGYRTRDSRQYQAAVLPLAYGNLAELVPVEDDQGTVNDATASRIGGSSARITVDTGTLSTQAPPLGVGRYAETFDLSLSTDAQCGDHAQYRATSGTIDEPRYPSIVVSLEDPPISASSSLTAAALAVDCGDLVTVTGTPAWLPPDGIKQHTIGQTETLGAFQYELDYVCTPTTPTGATGLYDVLGRYSPSGSTLTSSITSSATGAAALSITTAAGNPLWTTNVADFPLDIVIAGERITLSAISGTSSPQSATVSARSVNGVVKAQTAGAAIDIYDATYYAL